MSSDAALAAKTFADLLKDFPILDKCPGRSLQAKFVPFRVAALEIMLEVDTSDTYGCVGAFLSPEEFVAFQELQPGQAPEIYAPNPFPGDIAADASSVDLYLHQDAMRRHRNETTIIKAIQHRLHTSLPPHLQAYFVSETSGTVRYGTPAQQWATLQAKVGPLTAEHLQQEHAPLLAPYRPGTPLVDFFFTHDTAHRFRSRVGVPYAPFDKKELAFVALATCGLFTVSLRRYLERFPLLVDQTYEALKELILIEGERDLVASKTALSSAHAVHPPAAIDALHARIAALESKLSATKADSRHFCWSCGSRSDHPSHKCPRPKPGHERKATRRDPMGSSA